MQPQYPQQPYYGQPQPAPQATFVQPTFVDPVSGGGGSPLKIRELLGRACAVKPVKLIAAVPGKMFNGQQERDSVVFDVLVLDGPAPLQYGESRAEDGTGGPPVYQVDQLPALIRGVTAGGQEVVRACREVLDAGQNGVILCRVIRGSVATKGSPPFLLATLGGPQDPVPQVAAQVRAQLAELWTKQAMGQWTSPEPREINGGPRKPAGAAPVAQYPPQQFNQSQYAQQFTQPAAAPPQVQYPGYTAPQPTPAQVPAAPPGWDPNVWATLSPADQARFTG